MIGVLRSRLLVLATTAAFLLLLCAPSSCANDDIASYDDTRRMNCLKAIQAFAQEHAEINDAAEGFLEAMDIKILEQSKSSGITTLTAFPGENSSQVFGQYQHACTAAGGFFAVVSGILDCIKETDSPTNGRPSVSILRNNVQCFAPGEECDHYRNFPLDWQLDTKSVLRESCTLREGVDALQPFSSNTTAPMPPGKPMFLSSNPSYNRGRHDDCMDAFKEVIGRDDDLSDAMFDHRGHMQVETLQEVPVFTQREWYINDDNNIRLNEYKQICKKSGGSFDTFSGTLDCLPPKEEDKYTTVVEGGATCFPPAGCEGYTLAQWKIDTNMALAGHSCTVRPAPKDSSVKDGTPLTTTSSDSSDGNKSRFATVGTILSLVGLGIVGLAWIMKRRQKCIQQRVIQPQVEMSSAGSGDNELPQVS